MSVGHKATLLVCLSSLGMLGCQELPEVLWRGEHVDFAAETPERVCGGTREYLDRRTGQMLERLGSDINNIEYYFLDDVDDFCPRDDVASGCVEEGVVYSQMVPHLHEIVHARSGDLMPRILEEGLATYLGDPYPIRDMAPRGRWAELLTSNVNGLESEQDYARAAHFVAFLAERHGWEAVLELDAVLSLDSSVSQVGAALESVLGMSTEATLADYETYPDCTGFVDMSLACTTPAVMLDALNTTHERVVDCASADGIGPHAGMVFVEDVIELAPSIDGSRRVSGIGDGLEKGGLVILRRCGPCLEDGVGKVEGSGLAFVSEDDLPAGRYVVRFYLPEDVGPATVGVRISG